MMAPGGRFYWLVVPLLMSGCVPVLSVNDDEIDWKFPALSKDGCPDISGKYYTFESGKYPTGGKLFHWLTKSSFFTPTYGVPIRNYKPAEGVTVEILNSETRTTSIWTSIKQSESKLEVTMFDETGRSKANGIIDMKQPFIGCYEGALIMRGLRNKAQAEGNTGEVDYIEDEFRKLPDGSLQVRHWFSSRLRSNLTGKAIGPVQETFQTRTYPLVRE